MANKVEPFKEITTSVVPENKGCFTKALTPKTIYLSTILLQSTGITLGTPVFLFSPEFGSICCARVLINKHLLSNECILSHDIRMTMSVSFGTFVNIKKIKDDEISIAHSVVLQPDFTGRMRKNLNESFLTSIKAFILANFGEFYYCPNERFELSLCGQRCNFHIHDIKNNKEVQKIQSATKNTDDLKHDMDSLVEGLGSLSLEKKAFAFKAYRVTCQTSLTFQGNLNMAQKKNPQQMVTYEDIGGLEDELNDIKLLLELPLRSPQVFYEYGLQPPKGILLFGPPGTGKTLIAKAVANEMNAHVIVINGAEILGKFYGESEMKLRNIFEDAEKNSPAIIFIDEIDALCPKRENSTSEVEKRIVATMLTLMDSVSSKKENKSRLVVIGATNRPNTIDPALRRPGRFDREIEIGIPNSIQRERIFQKMLSKIPNTLQIEDIKSIASMMHGYVGADISALCKEAGLLRINRVLDFRENQNNNNDKDSKTNTIPTATTTTTTNTNREDFELVISKGDVLHALTIVKPSAMREVAIDIPKVLWTDVGGQHETKEKLKEAVTLPLQHPEAFERMGISPPRGVLLYGPPGCSKTLMAKALANESKLNFILVKGPELFSKWVGESEKAVRETFRKARSAAPSIVFFDEIDAIAGQRGKSDGGSSVGDRVLTQLLNELDGVETLKNVTVLAATNRPDAIDSALLRPGRIDRIIYVGPPDEESRKEIFRISLRKMPNSLNESDVDDLSKMTEGFSGAELAAICREAALQAIRKNKTANLVSRDDFEAGINGMTPQITEEMLQFYKDYSTGKKRSRK